MKYAIMVILFLCLWAYPAWAQGEDWIPEGAILENETEENGMRILSYLMPETGEMLAEMGSAGVMMAVIVTAVWVGMLAVSRFAEKKSLKSPADLLGGMQR